MWSNHASVSSERKSLIVTSCAFNFVVVLGKKTEKKKKDGDEKAGPLTETSSFAPAFGVPEKES